MQTELNGQERNRRITSNMDSDKPARQTGRNSQRLLLIYSGWWAFLLSG